jgi:hypothetical protein
MSGKQLVGGSAVITGTAASPQIKAVGSLANKVEAGK